MCSSSNQVLFAAAGGLLVGTGLMGLFCIFITRPMRRATHRASRGGAMVVQQQMDRYFNPPSGSMNPRATVPPRGGPEIWMTTENIRRSYATETMVLPKVPDDPAPGAHRQHGGCGFHTHQ